MTVRRRLLMVAVALAATACSSGSGALRPVGPGANYLPPKDRPHAADLKGTLLGGGQFDSTSTLGHVLVVNVWGSWCDPCRAEAPGLSAAWTQLQAQGVRLLGVDIEDTREAAQGFMRSHGLTYPSLFDPQGKIKTLYRYPVLATPTTYVIDSKGRIAAINYGKLTEAALLALVARVKSA